MKAIRGFIICIGLIVLWQLMVFSLRLPVYILPGPKQVWVALLDNWQIILSQTKITLIEALLGLLCGAVLGMSTAISMALFKPLRHWLLPVLLISQALPTFAIAPLLVIWLGYGMASKVVVTMLMLFFPVTSNFYDGLKKTPKHWLDMAKVMGASRWRRLWQIKIPAALPHLASGLRIAAVFAPMGAVIGEWVGASRGLGFLMLNANARLEIALMFACLFMIILMALLLYFVVDFVLKKLLYWY